MLALRNYFYSKQAVTMATSRVQTDADQKKEKETIVPLGIINDIQELAGDVKIPGNLDKTVSLESGFFGLIRTQRLKALLTAIVSGDLNKVKEILDIDPSLLLEQLEEKDCVLSPTGHKFNLKPYQAALAVDDTQMAAMIKTYFVDKLKNENEADKQYKEQCHPPKELKEVEEKKWNLIFDQLETLTLAIRKRNEGDITSSGNPDYIVTLKKDSAVEKELNEFWRLLDATRDKVITAGKKPFNPNLLLTAWQTYDDHFEDYFGNDWTDPPALLFWQKVIGYDGIQRAMPVNYVQAFHDWLDNTVEKLKNNKPQDRNTTFKIYRAGNWVPVDFYPLRDRGSLGFNFAIYGACAGGRTWGRGGRGIEAFVNQKQQAYRTYAAAPRLST